MVQEIKAAIGDELSAEPSKLVVTVLFTTVESTSTALAVAARLAKGFDARIEIVEAHIVPYPVPLDHPTVDSGFLLSRLARIADNVPVETAVHLCYGRDLEQILLSVLRPNSVVFVGEREPWWPGEYRKLAKRLRARSHQVIFTSRRKGQHA
jgi:hypothetical protein